MCYDIYQMYRPLRAGIYLLKVSNRNTRKMCEICPKLSVKTPERRRSGVFIFINLKHISYIVLSVFIVNFKSGIQPIFELDFQFI